jgi:hypothetical protein
MNSIQDSAVVQSATQDNTIEPLLLVIAGAAGC